jgi:hypothetical protein
MNIKHGDVITLDNGDVVKVSLQIVKQNITKLIPGKSYSIKYTGQFVHWYGYEGTTEGSKLNGQLFQYLGEIEHGIGSVRHVFYYTNEPSYLMMGDSSLDFIIQQID